MQGIQYANANLTTIEYLGALQNLAVDKINHRGLAFIPTKEHSLLWTLPHHPSQFIRIVTNSIIILYSYKILKQPSRSRFQPVFLHLP